MKKYVCSICGFVYDEARGIPEAGIAPGTRWEQLPFDWVCPLCGAAKSEFKEQGTDTGTDTGARVGKPLTKNVEMTIELNSGEISALCSNLARGCEKQYKLEESALFTELADFFSKNEDRAVSPEMSQLLALVERDLTEGLPLANVMAEAAADRGAMRALVWNEKVTRILKSLLTRYEKEGEQMLLNSGVFVCTICGFVFIGEKPPELCPICKVPSWKFEKILEEVR